MTSEEIFSIIQKVKTTSPLVHNITNFVVMNNTANALLAAGASPVMAHAKEEVADMVKIASALVINIGTLNPDWIEGMKKAIATAKELNKPFVLDPVGAGATPYRNEQLKELLNIASPTVIRGNASEIAAVLDSTKTTKGVDSTASSDSSIDAGKALNTSFASVVCLSGATDYVIDDTKMGEVYNGSPLMAKVTGLGCSATALIGAFVGVHPSAFEATLAAMAYIGVAGELAAKQSQGPGTLQLHLLDKLYNLNKEEFINTVNVKTYELA
ncbi:hydroxyethylthiazole kinase [Chondrinema litorale]|uniref:hydroxyethylthiazole kinase n=1 Tax=Chondrinema litorale TaxID=2994555 RepID=UPI00254343E8|nr:hydroxyethylthiazole kinase [Chondrinema litorale]UZR97485.1 hydroxyethylthiazole kinase [Chondrinema litorale]